MLAEYLANVIGYKTAVVENSLRGDLLSLQAQPRSLSKSLSNPNSEEGIFRLHQVTYSCYHGGHNGNSHQMQGFDCYVKDLGSSYARARELISACDLTFLLFTMTPWYCDWTTLTEKLKKDYGEDSRLCLVGNQIPLHLKKQLYQKLRCEFLDFEPNMFSPSLKAVQLFHQVLWNH
jgi:hypothetical protein